MIRYLSTAIGLTPGGSSTGHIYKQAIHRTTQIQTIHRTTQITTEQHKYVHEKFRRKECVVLYLRATYTPTRIYVYEEESFISVCSSNNAPHTERCTDGPRGNPPSKHDKECIWVGFLVRPCCLFFH